jgi:hypothetical protein
LAFENLNALLAVIATIVSVSFPFILRYLSKKDTQQEKTSIEIEERLDNYEERFDKYDERLRLAEIAIARNERKHNRG